MQLDSYFGNIWYVHTENGTRYDSIWTTRREARARKNALRTAGNKEVTVSFVPVSYGTITKDDHS